MKFRIFYWAILGLALLLVLPYAFSPLYHFPDSQMFSGNTLFNPYRQNSGEWYKCNFQGHSKAWSGVTDGKGSGGEYYDAYKNMGYDVVGLSNYQSISQPVPGDSLYIPVYEHGYNVWKRHHLCIGAGKVVWYDLPLFQTLHHKQFIINLIDPTTEVLAIAHPKFMHGFKPEDFSKLTGYDCIEVLNHYRKSFRHWDAALSAGRTAWIVGNDDTHDINNPDETGRYWTMIRSDAPGADGILKSLSTGNAYGVSGHGGFADISLNSVVTAGMAVSVKCDTIAKEFRFIGQNGDVRGKIENSDLAEYAFKADDTYIRTEIESDSVILYLNPVFRYNGNLNNYEAEINWFGSVVYWGCFVLFYGLLFLFGKRQRIVTRKKRD